MTWTAWSLLTPAEQAAIPKALITDVPGASGSISVELIKTLWTNSSPTADFAAQTITLASDDYDFLFFDYAYTANARRFTSITSKGCDGLINVAIQASNTIFGNPMRTITYGTATSITISDCSYLTIQNGGALSTATNNSVLIPIAIYGFKKSVSFDLTTLVADVSTSASKCMLSDNVTSVETAFTEAVKVVTASASMTIAANSYAVTNASFTLPTGYKAICACPLTAGSLLWSWSTCQLNNDGTVKMGINSRSSSSETFDVKALVICIRA